MITESEIKKIEEELEPWGLYSEGPEIEGVIKKLIAEVRTLQQPTAGLDQWWPTLLEASKRIEALAAENADLKLYVSQAKHSLELLSSRLPDLDDSEPLT